MEKKEENVKVEKTNEKEDTVVCLGRKYFKEELACKIHNKNPPEIKKDFFNKLTGLTQNSVIERKNFLLRMKQDELIYVAGFRTAHRLCQEEILKLQKRHNKDLDKALKLIVDLKKELIIGCE